VNSGKKIDHLLTKRKILEQIAEMFQEGSWEGWGFACFIHDFSIFLSAGNQSSNRWPARGFGCSLNAGGRCLDYALGSCPAFQILILMLNWSSSGRSPSSPIGFFECLGLRYISETQKPLRMDSQENKFHAVSFYKVIRYKVCGWLTVQNYYQILSNVYLRKPLQNRVWFPREGGLHTLLDWQTEVLTNEWLTDQNLSGWILPSDLMGGIVMEWH
jgi:hypothetical protein